MAGRIFLGIFQNNLVNTSTQTFRLKAIFCPYYVFPFVGVFYGPEKRFPYQNCVDLNYNYLTGKYWRQQKHFYGKLKQILEYHFPKSHVQKHTVAASYMDLVPSYTITRYCKLEHTK